MPTQVARRVVQSHAEPREGAVRPDTDNAALLVAAGLRSKLAEPKSPPFFHPRHTIRTNEHVVPQPLVDAVREQDHQQNVGGEDNQLR